MITHGSALVVGGAGFVGGRLVHALVAAGCTRVDIVDNLLSSERVTLPEGDGIRFIEGSIADDRILRALGDDYDNVFHLATYHGNQSSIANPVADHDNNLLTTLKLYERIKSFRRAQKVVYAGSGCSLAPHTFGRPIAVEEEGPVPLDLDSPYQISKVVGEMYSVYYYRQHSLPTVRARFQNVYGPGEVLGAGRWRGTAATIWRNVVPTFIYRALKGLPLRLENEGRASRDFIYVDDIVNGLMLCAANGQAGEVYNLASGTESTIAELAALINELTGNLSTVEIVPARSWDHAGRRFGSTTKSQRELGFSAAVSLEEGLRRTIDWTRANLEIIDASMAKHSSDLAASLT